MAVSAKRRGQGEQVERFGDRVVAHSAKEVQLAAIEVFPVNKGPTGPYCCCYFAWFVEMACHWH